MNKPVVTRFAPSPTGALHIGGARTALYSWAYARQYGGKFILRIEDTDRKRSTPQATQGILRDLMWLGLDWDEGPGATLNQDPYDPATQKGEHGPYFQSQRLDIYKPYAEQLIKEGKAYEDDGAIRFRQDKDISFKDEVFGEIAWKASDLEDFVIMKTDGFPTYHFAVVVDDHEMQVTHVIRGQEHLTNTAKHLALFDAFGWNRPAFAHTPSIMNPDGSKMSKRDKAKTARQAAKNEDSDTEALASRFYAAYQKIESLIPVADQLTEQTFRDFLQGENDNLHAAVIIAGELAISLPEIDVDDFRKAGYLPDVLLNYLALLGWNPGNDVERFDLDFMVKHFSLGRVNKANAKFDRTKLLAFNQERIAALPPDVFQKQMRAFDELGFAGLLNIKFADHWPMLCEAFQPRIQKLSDIYDQAGFLLQDVEHMQYSFDEKNTQKGLFKGDTGNRGIDFLHEFEPVLNGLPEENFGTLAHDAIKQFCEQNNVGMGKLAQPVRIAISGGTVTPPLDQTLELLGKAETLKRIQRIITESEKVNP